MKKVSEMKDRAKKTIKEKLDALEKRMEHDTIELMIKYLKKRGLIVVRKNEEEKTLL